VALLCTQVARRTLRLCNPPLMSRMTRGGPDLGWARREEW
jgi:hypothetical protein